MFDLKLSQAQQINFVMVDTVNTEVSGLGATFSVFVSKAGGAFVAGAGAKAEIGNGWYAYTLTAAETNTVGPLAVRVTGAGATQQNLEYVVEDRTPAAINFTYTVTNSVTLLPIQGVEVWISTDNASANVLWRGYTDTFGVARDSNNNLPRLDPGTYYFWRAKVGFTFVDPDTEIVS